MLIYKIQQELANDSHPELIPGMELIRVKMKEFDAGEDISLNNDFMFRRYGFRISRYERDTFITHYNVWKQFKLTDAPYCFVMEDAAHFRQPLPKDLGSITDVLEEDLEWDVLFPFEPRGTDEQFNPQYLVGYYWGMAAYFVSKKGVDKLLSITEIRQPVDEEILTMSLEDQLEVFCTEMNFLNYSENAMQIKHRNDAIREAVFESTAWSPANKRKVYEMMETISKIAADHSIDLLLCDGSLLGQVRHGGIMPWDDDVDLALENSRYKEFKCLIDNAGTLKIDIFYWGNESVRYAKIWAEDGEDIPGFSYKFPFVDIWFYREDSDQIIFDSGTVYPVQLYKPFIEGLFEGIRFKIPGNPQACLDISYSHWRTKIVVYPWSHRLEQDAFAPLFVDISTDQVGRII